MGEQPTEHIPRPLLRSSATNTLWGHILRRDNSRKLSERGPPSAPVPPIAPVDKVGTSMRILLHDTQANLEKFSDRVDRMLCGVEEAKREVTNIHRTFQGEHEKLLEETLDLASRCQKEIQKSLGDPAQAAQVEDIRTDLTTFGRKLEGLEQKLDVLQMVNQTQSQALQTIQEQQGKLLLAVAPLLPLLQAVPLHIDGAQNRMVDALRNAVPVCSPSNPCSCDHSEKSQGAAITLRNLKVPRVSLRSSPSGGAPSKKRRRLDTHPEDLAPPHVAGPISSPTRLSQTFSMDHTRSGGSKVALSGSVGGADRNQSGGSSFGSSSATSSERQDLNSGSLSLSSVRTPPCLPLADVLLQQGNGTCISPVLISDHGTQNPFSANGPLVGPDHAVATTIACAPELGSLTPICSDQQDMGRHVTAASLSAASSTVPAPQTSASSPLVCAHLSSGVAAAFVSSRASQTQRSPLRPLRLPQRTTPTRAAWAATIPQRRVVPNTERSPMQTLQKSRLGSPTSVSAMNIHTPLKPMSLKDRRALLSAPSASEGKRFIPLDDDEDGDSSDGHLFSPRS